MSLIHSTYVYGKRINEKNQRKHIQYMKKKVRPTTHNISVKSDNLEYLFYDDNKASYNSKCNDIDRFMKK